MYYISDLCHLCLKYEKSLINVGHKEGEETDEKRNEEIIYKLSLCVSEVDWAVNKNFSMCSSCMQKLNSAYDFKQQCIKSSDIITKYMGELKNAGENDLIKGDLNVALSREDVCKDLLHEYIQSAKEEKKITGFIRIVPEQKFFSPLTKLIVTNAGQGQFQNFYLNLIPTSMLNLSNITQTSSLKENTLVVGNVNNTVMIPSTTSQVSNIENDINVSQILENSKSEELSVDVDPAVFDCETEENADGNEKDWDEIISCNKISHAATLQNTDVQSKNILEKVSNYMPILPKISDPYSSEITNEEKMEFFNFGHFLTNPHKPSTKSYNMNMQCDICSQCFDTVRSLRNHIKITHNGNFPYKCGTCLAEFALRGHYESHIEKHTSEQSDNTITLENIKHESTESLLSLENHDLQANGSKEYKCDLCGRKFTTSQGLIRHKVRRHDEQRVRTKYFVKGMKNAKCNICNRSFSTQSYLQLHLKLHNRKGEWKRKIYNKEEVTEAAPEPEEATEPIIKQEEIVEPEVETEMCVDDQTDCDIDEDAGSTTGGDLSETNPTDIPPDNPPEEKASLKIRINLKDLAKSQEDFKLFQDGLDDIDVDVVSDNCTDANDEYNSNCDESSSTHDNTDTQESKLDAICLSEDNVQLQSQNSSVFKFEWVNGKPKCVYCQKMFGRKHDLKRHINNVHMKSIQYKCHICKRKFYEGFHLTRHLRGHYSSLACPQCNKKFCTMTDIKNHLMVSHDGIGNVDCGVCNISFDDLLILKDHIEDHLKTIIYKCHICEDEYKECRDLTKHIVEHSGVYTCSQCNRNFCTEKELVSHLRIHSSEVSMRHKCEICQNTFKKKRYLYSHLKNCHSIEKQDAEVLIDTVVCEYSNHS